MANPAYKKLYGKRWQRLRLAFLKANPLCVMCLARGFTVAAQVVDHIKAHKGDLKLFWDRNNWQALCKLCHDKHKQRQERLDEMAAEMCSADGYNPNSDW
jgi:5-methylcytosine-specific restriction protein A